MVKVAFTPVGRTRSAGAGRTRAMCAASPDVGGSRRRMRAVVSEVVPSETQSRACRAPEMPALESAVFAAATRASGPVRWSRRMSPLLGSRRGMMGVVEAPAMAMMGCRFERLASWRAIMPTEVEAPYMTSGVFFVDDGGAANGIGRPRILYRATAAVLYTRGIVTTSAKSRPFGTCSVAKS